MTDYSSNRRRLFFGNFILFHEIGRGGMGVVYSAQQTHLDRAVALKVLHPALADINSLQRLRIEAEAVAKLDHPNIVPLYEFGEYEGQCYLATRLIEGENLDHCIKKGNFSPKAAAGILAKIARAVHHAHERGILHRDLKPANILVDANGEPHLIDFGLAKSLDTDFGMTLTGAFLGTPAYASPEQVAGAKKSITVASDVYGLGAILYSILTGRAPFEGQTLSDIVRQVKADTPCRPRSVNQKIPTDLEIVCLKCLAKEPARRYQSALGLAEDLESFVNGHPISARPVGAGEFAWMWMRRHPIHAALGLSVAILLISTATWAYLLLKARAEESEIQNLVLRRQVLQQKVQTARGKSRVAGWSADGWESIAKAADIPITAEREELRNQAAALLAGLDARPWMMLSNTAASSVALAPQCDRLLLGANGRGAVDWALESRKMVVSARTNQGPVAFLDNGAGVQCFFDSERRAVILWDLAKAQISTEWRIPTVHGSEGIRLKSSNLLALTPDGKSGVAVLDDPAAKETIITFGSDSVRTLENCLSGTIAVSISPDGRLIVCANKAGELRLWSRDTSSFVDLGRSRNEVRSLALKPRIARLRPADAIDDCLLAVGDAGGTVTIWSTALRSPVSLCIGGHYGVAALAFSPDSTVLASGGRGPVKLWDVWTGENLLDIRSSDEITGLCFSSDGRKLAVSCNQSSYQSLGAIWELNADRGIKTLRGLSHQISKICFSSDGRKVAALSHGWDIGVWDLASGNLEIVFSAPEGIIADNAALALTADAGKLAFSADRTARLWDTKTGRELATWDLPYGLADWLGFPDDNHLISFRIERQFSRQRQSSGGVTSIRDLLRSPESNLICELPEIDRTIYDVSGPTDCRFFVVDGRGGPDNTRSITAFDSLTGNKMWSIPSYNKERHGEVVVSSNGKMVAVNPDSAANPILLNASTGEPTRNSRFSLVAMADGPRLYASRSTRSGLGNTITIHESGRTVPLVTLAIDNLDVTVVRFDAHGDRLAWGTTSGKVMICDLQQLRRRFTESGL